MRALKYILPLLILAASCNKQIQPEGTDMHEFTQEELQKKKLDDAFSLFIEALQPESVTDWKQEIKDNSQIYFPTLTSIRYLYTKDGKEIISAEITSVKIDIIERTFQSARFSAKFYGGMEIVGTIPIQGTRPQVLVDGVPMATLGLELREYKENGEVKVDILPVFRFPDGTSYAVTGILLVEPLIDYLIENALSTE